MADDARERIQKLLVTGDNRLKQGVAPEKVRASYEEALVVAREAGLEDVDPAARRGQARRPRAARRRISSTRSRLQPDVVIAGCVAAGEVRAGERCGLREGRDEPVVVERIDEDTRLRA